MQRNLSALTDNSFDVVVIGGGIFGACAAWDAAQRGLSVALIERGDFSGATSAHSFKIVHGGIRYLQHLDISRLRQSCRERQAFLRIAPHLVRPLPIAIPTYGRGQKGKLSLRVGMGVYDMLTWGRNRDIQDPTRRIPSGRILSRSETLTRFPGLPTDGLTGAAVFCDGQMFNPPRLVLACLKEGVRAGAVAANYVEATELHRRGRRVTCVRARDTLSGSELEIQGRVIINATGPYAEHLLGKALQVQLGTPRTYSRDACFVVPKRLLENDCALAVLGQTHDPDYVFSRGERHLFIAPWRNFTLIGVWHKIHQGHPDQFRVTDEELEAFLREVRAAYPPLKITVDDIALSNAGLVPFGQNETGAKHLRYGHRSELIDHAEMHGIDNLITLIGVRYTMGRSDASQALDLAMRKLGRQGAECRTHRTAVAGGDMACFESLVDEVQKTGGLSESLARCLAHNYGTEYRRVLRYAVREPGQSLTIHNAPTLRAEIPHAVREEMAQTLADVVFRRTDLATGDYPGQEALAECADMMAAELDWDAARVQAEIRGVRESFPARSVDRVDGPVPPSGQNVPLPAGS